MSKINIMSLGGLNENGKNLVYTKNYYKFNDLIETIDNRQ